MSFCVMAQCDDIEKVELGGTYSSKTRNYIPFEVKFDGKIEKEDTFYPYDIKNIEKYSDFILRKIKEYVIQRANVEFYDKLKMGQFQVNYPTSIKVKYGDNKMYDLSKYNVTYWVLHTYNNNGFEYAFGMEFDKDGKMISENRFPDFSLNPEFEKINEPCMALNKVKSNNRFEHKAIDLIELDYLEDAKSFCWLIKEKLAEPKGLGSTTYSIDLYYVNANSNEIEVIKQQTGTIIACGVEIKKIIKKKKN
jgi:hypothetical protein